MSKYTLYIIAFYAVSITASQEEREKVTLYKPYWGAVTANLNKETAENINGAVKTLATVLSPENLNKAGKSLTTGLVAGLDDKELAAKADALGKNLGEAAGAGLVTGAAGVVKEGLVSIPGAAKTAALTYGAPVAAGAVATGFAGYMGYVGLICHRENGFNRCLSRHFDNNNLNERGYPRRCESPERRLRYWYNAGAEAYIERFTIMKKKGLRPEGEYLGHSGIEDQKGDK